METYFVMLASACAVLGAISDLRVRRIPNSLTYSALAAGCAAQAYCGGWRGLGHSLAGALVGGGALLIFFLAGGLGAGDVKLMAAVGAWVGPAAGLLALLFTGLAGACIAVAWTLTHRRAFETLANVGALLRFHLTRGLRPHAGINLRTATALRIPYGCAIACGTLALLAAR